MNFDPFSDRTARDLRNDLSTALVAVLTGEDKAQLATAVEQWKTQPLTADYQAYLQDRESRYQTVMADIRSAGIDDPRRQSVMLWNAGLFFELHELLETIWHPAVEPERSALKGLIQAAGAYIHAQRGKHQAANGLAGRARTNMQSAAKALAFIGNLQELIDALQHPENSPPRLELSRLTAS